jgi:hypothetical protein
MSNKILYIGYGVSIDISIQYTSISCNYNCIKVNEITDWSSLTSVHTVTFGDGFNQDVSNIIWPINLQYLTFGRVFQQNISQCNFPDSIHTLVFSDIYGLNILHVHWPISLHTLSICINQDVIISQIRWPPNLKTLTLSAAVLIDVDISDMIWPPELNTLSIGKKVIYVTMTFPDSIHILKLGSQSLTDSIILPRKLISLTMCDSYCHQKVEDVMHMIPKSLEHFNFGKFYWNIIDDIDYTLFESLTSLTLGNQFNKGISRVKWPSKLATLTFGDCFNQDITHATFPETLTILSLGRDFNQTINYVKFPVMLEVLYMSSIFNHDITIEFPSLTKIIFGMSFTHTFPLMPSLIELLFGAYYNRSPMSLILSDTIYKIEFGHNFNQDIINVQWPKSLGIITFGYSFNQPLTLEWPMYLHTITFGNDFAQSILHVKFLNLGTIYDYSGRINIDSCAFPKSLQKIIRCNPDTVIYEKYVGSHTKMAIHDS